MNDYISPLTLEVVVLLLGVILLMMESFSKPGNKDWIPEIAIFVLGFLFFASAFTTGDPTTPNAEPIWRFYTADSLAIVFKQIALATTVLVLVMSLEYRKTLVSNLPTGDEGAGLGEFYSLPIFTCAGLMFMASAKDFLFIFVALELVTISFYILVAFMRRSSGSLEAGVKYLILGALSTGFLVYGITWIFGVTGQTNLAAIEQLLRSPNWHGSETALLFGLMLVLIGLGFKVAAAPFQLWVPDVYQGAPTPITAFLSVGSKAAGFIVLMRVVATFVNVPHVGDKLIAVIAILAGLSVVYGNLAAIPQDNLKRLLAYSSVGHAGYLLIAVASVGSAGSLMFGTARVAIGFYLAGYLLMTLLVFLVMIVVARHSRGDDIIHFNGLAKRSPFLAFGMLIGMLSLAGLPFTVGFYGKFLVFAAAWNQAHYTLVALGVITVGAGFYYYLRVITAMYWQEPADDTKIEIRFPTRVAVVGLSLAIIVFGIFPSTLISQFQLNSTPSVATATAPAELSAAPATR